MKADCQYMWCRLTRFRAAEYIQHTLSVGLPVALGLWRAGSQEENLCVGLCWRAQVWESEKRGCSCCSPNSGTSGRHSFSKPVSSHCKSESDNSSLTGLDKEGANGNQHICLLPKLLFLIYVYCTPSFSKQIWERLQYMCFFFNEKN